ncbi:PEP-CTERM sorting domain-containing protein [Microcoleus sp. D3_18a_C4]|uniref:PEP-CTERM sorting domain-containing protein n=1 Tax=unclassified Microcoleus TaxID=2642155 RepID=UPI002FD2D6D7
MCTPLAKLAIGLSATMATAFYYLAAAPPASAKVDVCGPFNYSSACVPGQASPPPRQASTPTQPDPEVTTEPSLSQIYTSGGGTAPPPTAIPEPGTAIAVLLIGAGMIGSCRKRNKQVGPQR